MKLRRIPATAFAVAALTMSLLAPASLGHDGDHSEFIQDRAERVDPYRDLSDKERLEADQAAFNQYLAHYEQWLADFRGDAEQLPRRAMNLSFAPPPETLQAAVQLADAIAVVEVQDLTFRATFDTVMSAKVSDYIKGSGDSSVTIVVPGGPQPEPDWQGAFLAYSEANPIIFPGQKALLFLQHDELGRHMTIQPLTGWYSVDAKGTVRGLGEFLPIDGKTLEAARRQIVDAANESSASSAIAEPLLTFPK